jgi:hypothetical protein
MTDGTVGVLYNRDDSCSPDTLNTSTPWPFYAPTPKLSEVPKIAFIKKQGGSCTLAQKILNAQSEGAIGAIVYDTTANGTTFEDRKAVSLLLCCTINKQQKPFCSPSCDLI